MSSPFVSSAPSVAPVAQPALKNRFMSLMQGAPYPLMVIVAIIVLTAVIVFIIIKYKQGSLKSTPLLKQQIILANAKGGDFTICPAGTLPSATNGSEFSYSLWVYVDNISITQDHKNVVYRGNSQNFANGTFFVYMDAKTNSLYASVRTNGALDESTLPQPPSLNDVKNNKYFLQSAIDYIPLQRWVNISYTVKDTTLSTFLDGDLYSVTSIYELPTKTDGSRPLISTQSGDIMVGGKIGKEGFNGYIGNCLYYNFAMTIAESKVVYNKGPYQATWLSYLGFSNVGLRSPIYTIGADSAATTSGASASLS